MMYDHVDANELRHVHVLSMGLLYAELAGGNCWRTLHYSHSIVYQSVTTSMQSAAKAH